MLALTVEPGVPGSGRVEDVAEPNPASGSVLVRAEAVGVCGTDREILAGAYGVAPPGERRLILGHESLGRVMDSPPECGLRPGDLVVGIVRRPDPVPCPSCARGEWDMCQNGLYTEHGIKGLHGFAAERFRLDPRSLVLVDPALGRRGVLIEPASVVAKAWDHIDRIGARAYWKPRRVLVAGAGAIGLLAALLGVERGLEVHVFDRVTSGPKPDLVSALGAHYRSDEIDPHLAPDVVIECTGAPAVVLACIELGGPNAIVCLTGISSGGRTIPVDAGALGRELVLENNVVFGSVNANRTHYEMAVAALLRAEQGWLDRILTRSLTVSDWEAATRPSPDDVKTVLTFD